MAHVQSASAAQGGFAPVTVAFGSNVAAGNTIAVYVFANNTTVTFTSASDTLGNTYTQVDTVAGSSGKAFTLYAKNITGGACTVTVVLSAQNFNTWIAVNEFSGRDTSAPLDAHNMTANEDPGTATDALTSGTGTTTVNGCDVFGATGEAGFASTVTVGTGFTLRETTTDGRRTETLVQSTAGSIAATFTTNTGAADYVTAMMAFKPAAAGSSSVSPSVSPSASASPSASQSPSASISPSPAPFLIMQRTVLDYID